MNMETKSTTTASRQTIADIGVDIRLTWQSAAYIALALLVPILAAFILNKYND